MVNKTAVLRYCNIKVYLLQLGLLSLQQERKKKNATVKKQILTRVSSSTQKQCRKNSPR